VVGRELGRREPVGAHELGSDEDGDLGERHHDPADEAVAKRGLDHGEVEELSDRRSRLEREDEAVGRDDERVERQ
jgi:hypothetical protein